MNSKANYYNGFGILFIILGIVIAIYGVNELMANSNYLYSIPALAGGVILLLIGLALYHQPVRQARIIAKQKAIQEYIDSIAPADMVSYTPVKVDQKDADNDLGHASQPIKYMFINQKKEVTFPESGNNQKYYIINVDFTPKYNQTVNGTTQTFGNNYGNSYGGFNQNNGLNNNIGSNNYSTPTFNQGTFNGTVSKYEVPTDAFMTLVSAKLDRSFTLHLIGEKQKHIQNLKQYCLLNDFEQKQVGIK
ncbi:hypothetical protein ACYATM_06360 [Lactobacillaceae bacterium Scapto_B20]